MYVHPIYRVGHTAYWLMYSIGPDLAAMLFLVMWLQMVPVLV